MKIARCVDKAIIESFFKECDKCPRNLYFHPDLSVLGGLDEFWGFWLGEKLMGFGFIRGWQDNWPEKVLGVAVLPRYQRMGIATALCYFLEVRARWRLLTKLRLHVHSQNTAALELYKKLGYEFKGKREDGEWIGRKNLRGGDVNEHSE